MLNTLREGSPAKKYMNTYDSTATEREISDQTAGYR